MKRSFRAGLIALFASLALAGTAQAADGNYVLEGGSPEAQETVRAAVEASRFDFDSIPTQITIRISSCGCAGARPGLIVLDGAVVTDTSLGDRYSWGVIQNEFAHQVDFSLFDDADRAAMRGLVGGKDWCYERAGLLHDQHGCERFSDVFTWAFWPTKQNIFRAHAKALAPQMTAKELRGFINGLLVT
jgi:hypothetical protein